MLAHTCINARRLALSLQQIGSRGFALSALAAVPGLAWAELPSGGTVAGGAASIANLDANHQRITQTTDRAIINWQTFSIGASDYVQFIQPSTSSVALNRVTGGNPSSILGSLSANGQVFLVNPNGVYFGPGAQIDVAGLVATTLSIGDGDFMAGRYVFSRDPASPARAEVINQGVIAAREGGYVVLAGDYAANSGAIQARLGTVVLAAGSKLTLDLAGDRLISYSVDEKTLAQLAGVSNTGQLMADGGRVFMTAKVAGDLAAMVVNSEGLVQAQSTVEHNGEIYLAAEGGGIRVTGTLDASAQPGANGGHVSVVSRGGGDTVLASGSLIRVSGNDLAVSNAGTVYTWADGTTRFENGALIEARGGANGGDGGFVEVSGHSVVFRGMVDARAPRGKLGTLLLDPNVINIALGDGSNDTAGDAWTIYETNLETALHSANVELIATGADATITLQTQDGLLDGRSGSAGGGLTLGVTAASGAPVINLNGNSIAVGGDLKIGNFASGGGAGTGAKPDIMATGNIALTGGSVTINSPFTVTGSANSYSGAKLSVTANTGDVNLAGSVITVTNTSSGSSAGAQAIFTANNGQVTLGQVTVEANTLGYVEISGLSVNLNGPITVKGNSIWGSSSWVPRLSVTATNGDITHAAGAANAITVTNNCTSSCSSAGARATFTASNGQVTLGQVSVETQGSGSASLYVQGVNGVTLGGAITVTSKSGSNSGAKLEVGADNGNITHETGHIQITNSGGGGAIACFHNGNGCSSGGSGGMTDSISLGQVTATANSGYARILVNADGGIAVNDNLTATGQSANVFLRTSTTGSGAITGITLAAGKAIEAAATTGPATVTINSGNSSDLVELNGAVRALSTGNSASISIYGGNVSTSSLEARSSSGRAKIYISGRDGVTLNGDITVAGNSDSSSRAALEVRADNGNINHTGGHISVTNTSSGSSAMAKACFTTGGGSCSGSGGTGGAHTITLGKVTVDATGSSGRAQIMVNATGGISLNDDVTAQGGYSGSIGVYTWNNSATIALAANKTVKAIGSSDQAQVAVQARNNGTVDLANGSFIAEGGATSGNASISVSGGDVTLGAVTAMAGNSAQISVTGTNITLGNDLTAANSIQLSPNYNGATGNIVGNGHNLATGLVQIRGGVGTGAYDITTNAATIDVQGGGSITVNAAAQAGTLTALLGGGSSNQAVGDVAITTAGALDITRLWSAGTTHFLRADTLTLPGGGITMPAGSAVTLKPYTLTNTVGVYSATDTDAAINTNYSDTLLNLFAAGTSFTIGGATGGQQTGDIHVGADGAFNLGDKNIVFDTSGSVVTHNAPTTTGTVTVIVPVVPVVPPPASSVVEPEVAGTFTSVVADLDQAAGGGDPAGNNEAGRRLAGLWAPGGAGYSPPPGLYEIRAGGVNIIDDRERNRSGP